MSRPLVAALEKLLAGSGDASASSFTKAQRHALNELARQTQTIRIRPQGAGSVYQVVDTPLLREHLNSLRPHPARELADTLPARAANIGHGRASKGRAHGHDRYYLLIKAVGPEVVWRHGDGRVLELSRITSIAGAGALAVQTDDTWHSEQPLWLVENQALFDRLDWMPSTAHGAVAYYAGQLDGRLLRWLAERPRTPQLIFFPDYDGVGLLNYARLLEVARSPCTFWLMPNWRACLQRYGSNAVWRNTLSEFAAAVPRLEAAGAGSEVLELCVVLRNQGLALEHESVWLSGRQPGVSL